RGGAPRAHGRRGGRKGSRLRLRSFVAGPDLADRFFAGAPFAVDRIVAAREVEPWVCTLESPPPRQVSLPAVFAGYGARRRREDPLDRCRPRAAGTGHRDAAGRPCTRALSPAGDRAGAPGSASVEPIG